MAKSARASAVKKNKSTLKKTVFGPVETARNGRLSARLLELASQPKPLRSEMEVEQDDRMPHQTASTSDKVRDDLADPSNSPDAKDAADAEAKEDQATGGVSQSSLSIPIPASLLHSQLPTPPESVPLEPDNLDIPALKLLAKELLFYHLLGTSTDIVGFDRNGDLQLSFA